MTPVTDVRLPPLDAPIDVEENKYDGRHISVHQSKTQEVFNSKKELY